MVVVEAVGAGGSVSVLNFRGWLLVMVVVEE